MKPDLEVAQIGRAESFKAWEHGYPFRTVKRQAYAMTRAREPTRRSTQPASSGVP